MSNKSSAMSTKRKRISGSKCCVVGCKNNNVNSPGTRFYSFSVSKYKREQREKWIKAVRRVNPDGTPWIPTKGSCICSRHFIGNEKSQHPHSPNFVPTIFPTEYYGQNTRSNNALKQAQQRFIRATKRTSNIVCSSERNNEMLPHNSKPRLIEFIDVTQLFKDKAVQVFTFPEDPPDLIFTCNSIRDNSKCDAQTQANFPSRRSHIRLSEVRSICDVKIEHVDHS